MKEELVSIIIPAYNAEKYLKKCLESVISQTYQNLEIFVVDDGSVDDTRRLVLEFARQDERVHYIYQKNSGVSTARNIGIEKSSGAYIIFVDADDFLETDMIQKELGLLDENDGIFFEYLYETIDGICEKSKKVLEYGRYNKKDLLMIIRNMCGGGLYYSTVWRGLYRSDIIKKNHLRFRPVKFAEDLMFNIEYIFHCESVIISEASFYHYCEHSQTAVKKIQYDLQYTIDAQKEDHDIFNKYRDRGLEEIYPRQVEVSCTRILDTTLTYQKFQYWVSQLDVLSEVKDFAPENRIAKYLLEKRYLKLYIFLWYKKIRRKLFGGA